MHRVIILSVIHFPTDSSDKYDSRDVDRLWKDDVLVDGYLEWRHFVVEDTLKMIDESLQWRKEFKQNGGLTFAFTGT
jgi:hypothetical protein